MTTDSWYHRHETERCWCGHLRRDHPRQPFIIDGTPGCTGLNDYATYCECPIFRYADEQPPEPTMLDLAFDQAFRDAHEIMGDDAIDPRELERETPEDRATILHLEGRRRWMAGERRRSVLYPIVLDVERERFIAELLREGIE